MDEKMSAEFMNEIPLADANADTDSSSGDETSIIAIASTVESYRYEHGRRYHAFRDGSYWAPNDDITAAYEKVVHHLLLRSMHDRLYIAPVPHPKRVLDIGTGIGLWPMDMGDRFEDAEIFGIDLSPVQPTPQPNVHFDVDDVTSEWTYPKKFDLIHMRMMYGAVEDFDALYQQCFQNLEPGGYIEEIEWSVIPHSANGPVPHESILWRWVDLAQQCSVVLKKNILSAESMKGDIEKAGFTEVTERRLQFPIGTWSSDFEYKTLGKWFRQVWWTGMEGWILMAATKFLGWTPEQVRDFVQETRKEMDNKSKHYYYEGVLVYGKKP